LAGRGHRVRRSHDLGRAAAGKPDLAQQRRLLLEAMADTLLTGVPDLDQRRPWHERLAHLAHRLRHALLSRRDGARLFSGAFFPLPNALAYGETMIATLREGGLSSRDASWAADTLTYYVVGHTIEEQLAASLAGGGTSAAARLAEAVDPQRHPHMYAALTHIPAPHHEQHFDYGLHLLIAGIRSDTTTEHMPKRTQGHAAPSGAATHPD
jgi:TetR/AcrR family tetracycline transcriptional repressor